MKRHIPNFLTHSAPATVWDELLHLIHDYVVSVADLVGRNSFGNDRGAGDCTVRLRSPAGC